MDQDLAELLQGLAALQQRLAQAVTAGDEALVADLWARVRAAEIRRDELLARATPQKSAPGAGTSNAGQGPSAATGHNPGEAGARAARRPKRLPPADRLLPQRSSAERGSLPGVPDSHERPMREVVLDVLHLVGRPVAVPLMRDIVRVRDHIDLPAARFASLRRDEERSYRTAATRPAYVVPALASDRFTPVRAVLASSVFPLPVRLIAPASSRVDFLYTVMALADDFVAIRRAGTLTQRAGGAGDDTGDADADRFPVQQGVESENATDRALRSYALLLARLARTVPGAMSGSGITKAAGGWIDLTQIHDAAAAELGVLADDDAAEREAAADRARAQLDVNAQLFGFKPRVISNPAIDRRKEA